MSDNYLTLDQVAESLQIPPATMRYWRAKGVGPKSAKLGGLIRYRASDVEAWVEAQFANAVGDDLAAAGQ